MLFDIDGSGEREYVASAYTALVYEQEFGADMVDEFIAKFTTPSKRRAAKAHSLFLLRVLWAMGRTADMISGSRNERPEKPVPAKFEDWLLNTGSINVEEVNYVVTDEFQRGLLRAADTESGENGGQEQPEE